MAVQIDVRANAEQAQRSLNQLNSSVKNIESSANDVNKSFENLGRVANIAAAAIAAAFTANSITRAADSYKRINTQLKLATTNANQLLIAQRNVNKIAIETRNNIESSASLYARLNATAIRLNRSQKDTAKATRAISQAIQISGSSAASAQAAIIQLGQGLASGTLRGEELNSVLEQAPRVARALADELKISVGQLRKVASEGKLTSSTVFNALVNQSAKINQEFQSVNLTVSQATTVLGTGITTFVAAFDRSIGLSDSLAKRILAVGTALNDFGTEFEARVDILEARLLVFRIQVVRAFKQGVNAVKDALDGIISVSDLEAESQKILKTLSDVDLSGINFSFNLSSFDDLIKGIQDGTSRLQSAYADVEAFVHGVMALFEEALSDIITNSTWTDTINGIAAGAEYLVTTVLPEITKFVNAVKDLFKTIIEADFGNQFQETISNSILNLDFSIFSATNLSETLATEVKLGIEKGVNLSKNSLNSLSENIKLLVSESNEPERPKIVREELPSILIFDNYLKDAGNVVKTFGDILSGVVDTLSFILGELETIDIAVIVGGLSLLSQSARNAVGTIAAPGSAIAQAITDRRLTPKLQARRTDLGSQQTAASILAGFDDQVVRDYNSALAAQAEIANASEESIKNLGGALNAADSRVQANIESLRKQAGVSQEAVEELRKFNALNKEEQKNVKLGAEARRLQRIAADRARTSAGQLAEAEQRLADARLRTQKRTEALIQGTSNLFSTAGGAVGASIGFEIGRDFIEVVERDIGDLPGWAEAGITVGSAFLGQISGQVLGTAVGTVIGTGIATALASASALTAAGAGIATAIATGILAYGGLLFFPEETLALIESVFGKGAADFVEGVRDGFVGIVADMIGTLDDFLGGVLGGNRGDFEIAQNARKSISAVSGQIRDAQEKLAIAKQEENTERVAQLTEAIEKLVSINEENRAVLAAKGFANGGRVTGPGTGRSDSIPARLSNGEFVVNSAATSKNLSLLQSINNGMVPGFSKGAYINSSLIQQLTKEEGFKSEAYLDSRNFPTIGYGKLLKREVYTKDRLAKDFGSLKVTESQALRDLINYLKTYAIPESEDFIGSDIFAKLPKVIRNGLISAVYNLGSYYDNENNPKGILEFKNLKSSLTKGDYAKAGYDLLDSVAAKQAISRYANIANSFFNYANKVDIPRDYLEFLAKRKQNNEFVPPFFESYITNLNSTQDKIKRFVPNLDSNTDSPDVGGFIRFLGKNVKRGFTGLLKKANGGKIVGPGTSKSDSIPAMLSNGEFVVNAESTSRYRGLLDQINAGTLASFSGGTPATNTRGSSTTNVIKQLKDLTGKTISSQEYNNISKAEQNTVKSALSAIETLNLEAKEADAVYAVELQESIERMIDIIDKRLGIRGGSQKDPNILTPNFIERVLKSIDTGEAGKIAGEDFVANLRTAIIRGEGGGIKQLLTGFVDTFTKTLVNQLFEGMTKEIGTLTSSLFKSGGPLSGGFSSIFSSIGGFFNFGGGGQAAADLAGGAHLLTPFSTGGMVPGAIGAPLPALVHGGEMILNPTQQKAVFGSKNNSAGVDNVTVNLQVVGDVSRATREEVVSMLPEIADNTQRVFNERRLLNGAR